MVIEPVVNQTNLQGLSDYSLQLNRWFLKPIGAWPSSPSTSITARIVSLILIIVCYCAISVTVIPCLLHIILDDDDLRMKLKVVGPLSHWFFGGVNYTTLLLHSKEIRCCVDHMRTDWQSVTRLKDQQVMLNGAKFGRYVAALCAVFMQGGVLTYCAIMATTTVTIQVGNETRTIRLLPCTVTKKLLPVDTSPTNEIILFSQFVSGFIVNSAAVGAFSLAAVFAAHAQGQLSVLMMVITEFVNGPERQTNGDRLIEIGVIVQNHLRVLSFISRIEDVMNEICFMELFKCTFDICMLGYYILTEWDDQDFRNLITYAVILSSMTFNIFIVCYIGEKLTEQCKKVGEVVYMTNWYHLPYKNVRDLMLIVSRSSKVINITAGKIVHMSIQTFSGVMKSAFTYVNVLRQTT